MRHRHNRLDHRLRAGLIGTAACAAAFAAWPQASPDLATARARYEQQIAMCNRGDLPAPEREACVRNAGLALDRARGGPPSTEVVAPSADGRATIVTPDGAAVPPGGSDIMRSPDGRATIVRPADQSPTPSR